MSLGQARIIKAASLTASPSRAASTPPSSSEATRVVGLARRLPREVFEAHGEAARILIDARRKASDIVAEAKASAASRTEIAVEEACEREIARVAVEVLVARSNENQADTHRLDRILELAVLLAERLVGEALAVDAARVGTLALEALKQARGARRVRVEACPEDVAALTELLTTSLGDGVALIEPSSDLTRGSLIVHTELGRVDARVRPQLSRLSLALRELLAESPAEGEKKRPRG